jgi:hypothetical protein
MRRNNALLIKVLADKLELPCALVVKLCQYSWGDDEGKEWGYQFIAWNVYMGFNHNDFRLIDPYRNLDFNFSYPPTQEGRNAEYYRNEYRERYGLQNEDRLNDSFWALTHQMSRLNYDEFPEVAKNIRRQEREIKKANGQQLTPEELKEEAEENALKAAKEKAAAAVGFSVNNGQSGAWSAGAGGSAQAAAAAPNAAFAYSVRNLSASASGGDTPTYDDPDGYGSDPDGLGAEARAVQQQHLAPLSTFSPSAPPAPSGAALAPSAPQWNDDGAAAAAAAANPNGASVSGESGDLDWASQSSFGGSAAGSVTQPSAAGGTQSGDSQFLESDDDEPAAAGGTQSK